MTAIMAATVCLNRPVRKPSPRLRRFGRIFVTGLLTLLPVIATIYFTLWVLGILERFFGKQVVLLLPDEWYRTGMGLLVAIVVIFATGLLMHGLLFRRLFGWAEWLLLEIPFVRSVYSALRDLLGLFADHKDPALQVVSLKLWGEHRILGFVTRNDFDDLPEGIAGKDEIAVYLPMSYQIGGFTVFVPRMAVTPVEMSREDAMKFILTAGLKSAGPAPSTQPATAPAKAGTRGA
jgi:uncharacterized membrane protein